MRCHICGKKATGKDSDPYIDEIYRDEIEAGEMENPEVWWCDECYQERLWDI